MSDRYILIAPPDPNAALDALRLAADAADREAGVFALATFQRETPEALRAYAAAEDRASIAHAAHAATFARRTSSLGPGLAGSTRRRYRR